jgi:hypothetical protein
MAITRSEKLRHSSAARDTLTSNSHHYPLIEYYSFTEDFLHPSYLLIKFMY